MWVEAGQPPDTFWKQTQRSFANTLAGAAKRNTKLAYLAAGLTGVAFAGKLKSLDEYLPSDPETTLRTGNAKLLHGFRMLQESGVHMTIERLH